MLGQKRYAGRTRKDSGVYLQHIKKRFVSCDKIKEQAYEKIIVINIWDRKEHFEFYSKIATPHYCVAFNIDVTNLLAFTRKSKISFYYSLIYLCTQSINEIDEFLLETEDNKVYKIDRRVPCFTDLKKGATSFHMVSLPCNGDIIEFATNARNYT